MYSLKCLAFKVIPMFLILFINCKEHSFNNNCELTGTWQLKSIYFNQNQKLPFDFYTITFNGEDSYQSTGFLQTNLGIIPFTYSYYNRKSKSNIHIQIDNQKYPQKNLNYTIFGYITEYDVNQNKKLFIATAGNALIVNGNQSEVLNYEFEKL